MRDWIFRCHAGLMVGVLISWTANATAAEPGVSAYTRAAKTGAEMTVAERTVLTHGIGAVPNQRNGPLPPDAIIGAGFVPGVPRLGIPSLRETDAGLGVGYVGGLRHDDGATPLPSGIGMGATWNPELVRSGGAMIGAEAKAKGFNVMLAGGVNLVREPRNGRNFEYLSEDPILSGVLGGAQIAGIQSNHIISTVKHFALNDQETGRDIADSRIADSAARESDLLAFQIAIEQGQPGAVMCGYNLVNGVHNCDSNWLLNEVLKRDWGYKGFVMSDWGAVPGVEAALHGLDQESAAIRDRDVFFGAPLATAAAKDHVYATRLEDMNRRILYAMYANGLMVDPQPTPINHAADEAVSQKVAEEAIVLLRNTRNVLPLSATAKNIAVIGGYAGNGVLAGGGSTLVQLPGGPTATIPVTEDGPLSIFINMSLQRSIPLNAIRNQAKGAQIVYRNGRYLSEAVAAARAADVVIVFATQWSTEGYDLPTLSLPEGQDDLIAAVAQANPNTVVVVESAGAILMPWLNDTAAVVEAWYPGGRGADAIASVLFGETNPSGRLPITFPAGEDQLPRERIDGIDTVELGPHSTKPWQRLTVNYDIEGADVGYRWYARRELKPLFPFGFGLSYTNFSYSDLKVTRDAATVTVTNVGDRAGKDVAQIYLTSAADHKTLRLVGFKKVELAPGESRTLRIPIEQRILARWRARWEVDGGTYRFAVGPNAMDLGPAVALALHATHWK